MKNWSLSKKIWGIFSLLIISFIGCMYIALSGMKDIGRDLDEITNIYVKRDQLSSDIQYKQRLRKAKNRKLREPKLFC
ncbi:MAG: hypothetical protein H7336_01990 [Bacteriovorax sp.]|nr:hypothetical protein [Bacteriovorax sp.]